MNYVCGVFERLFCANTRREDRETRLARRCLLFRRITIVADVSRDDISRARGPRRVLDTGMGSGDKKRRKKRAKRRGNNRRRSTGPRFTSPRFRPGAPALLRLTDGRFGWDLDGIAVEEVGGPSAGSIGIIRCAKKGGKRRRKLCSSRKYMYIYVRLSLVRAM